MVSTVPAADFSAAIAHSPASSTPPKAVRHWLTSRYFVPLPDLSDETCWIITKGKAWPAFIAILRLLRQEERKGRGEQVRADACEGKLTVGINRLTRATGCVSATTLRQVRYLERQGLIRTHKGACEVTQEVDPVTGKITAKRGGKVPPKVIILTLGDHHYRPTRPTKASQRTPQELSLSDQGIPQKLALRPQEDRARNRPTSRDGNLHRDSHPMDGNKRRQPQPSGGRQQPPQRQQQEQRGDRGPKPTPQEMADRCAIGLGWTQDQVRQAWKEDYRKFFHTVVASGLSPQDGLPQASGRRSAITFEDHQALRSPGEPRRGRLSQPPVPATSKPSGGLSTFDIRRQATQAVTLDARRQEDATGDPTASCDDTDQRREEALRTLKEAEARARRKAEEARAAARREIEAREQRARDEEEQAAFDEKYARFPPLYQPRR